MKIEQLSYFLETAKTEHIGRASKILGISPSAISHSIALLEEELGRQLFSKKGKNIVLTTHGKALMERASKLLYELHAIQEEMRSENAELLGNYTMAATHALCLDFLTPAWIKLQKEYPRLTGEIFTLRSAQVLEGTLTGKYDLGLCFSPNPHPDISSANLYSGKIHFVVRKGHSVLKMTGKKRIEALNQFPAALPKSFQGIDVCERHPIFAQYKIVPRPGFLFDSYPVGLKYIAESDAWSFVPDWLIAKEGKSVVVLLEEENGKSRAPSAPYQISAIWPKDRYVTEGLKRITANLKEVITQKMGVMNSTAL